MLRAEMLRLQGDPCPKTTMILEAESSMTTMTTTTMRMTDHSSNSDQSSDHIATRPEHIDW
jgi:hypothetical protein